MDSREAANKPWPNPKDYPQTEVGINQYLNDWVGRRRLTAMIGQIPMEAIQQNRAANELLREKGWREMEG